jgi:polysaccharide export outer membrane protein
MSLPNYFSVKYLYRKFSGSKLKNRQAPFLLLMGWILIQLSSCASYKHIPYFQNISSDTSSIIYKDGVQIKTTDIADIVIQPNDILDISIQTIDPQLNAVMMANPGSDNSAATSMLSGAGNSAGGMAMPNGNMSGIAGYLVDKDGMVELPIAGKVKVGGLTTAVAKEQIRQKATGYYKDPIVNVRIANFKVTVIGEVSHPGAYLINGERATILDALGQAGDITIYGMRTNVLLSRVENGRQKMVRFDLTSTDLYNSPYFYLKQGDMIYVQPARSKAASSDGTLTRTYALISSTLALVVILATRNY